MNAAMTGWQSLAESFERERLPVPAVPTDLRPALRQREFWCWATREVSSSDMYLFRPYPVHGVFAGHATDYIAVNHSGHGVNSYAITYQLVYRGLAIFTQVEWGGIYTDNDAAARRLTDVFDRCQNLTGLADRHEFTPESPWRLLCLDSGLRDVSAVGWIRVPDPDVDATWRFTQASRVEPGTAFQTAERLFSAPPPTADATDLNQ
jgi:hypothetical protein